MAGHAQLKFVMTECSKTQIRLAGLTMVYDIVPTFRLISVRLKIAFPIANFHFRLPICNLKRCFNVYRSRQFTIVARVKSLHMTRANSEGSCEPAHPTVSPEPLLFALIMYGTRESFRQRTRYEPRHVKTTKMAVRPAKTQISLRFRPV